MLNLRSYSGYFFITYLFLVWNSFSLSAQENQLKSRIDSLFQSLDTSHRFMGSVVLRRKGEVIYAGSMGFDKLSDSSNIRSSSISKYRIGSITKMFTAVMIFQAIEEGKLSLNTPLSRFYPMVKFSTKITIGQMLNHHSGIYDFSNDPRYKEWSQVSKTHDQIVDIIASYNSKDTPGVKPIYSNSNYVLLGFILEKVTRQSYEKNLQQRIIQPLGLKQTYVGGKIGDKSNEAYSYRYLKGEWIRSVESNLNFPAGAGCIVSSPGDLTIFLEALFNHKIIHQESLVYMYSKTNGFGMGMFQFPFIDKKAWGHSGGIDAFSSMAVFFPEDSLTFGICSNGQVYPINDVVLGILSIYFNKPYSIPTFNQIRLTSEQLDQYLGVYSSTQIPVKVTVTKEKDILMAQGSGKSAFPLEPTDKDKFIFTAGGIIMEFMPEKGGLLLKQGGISYYFTRNQ